MRLECQKLIPCVPDPSKTVLVTVGEVVSTTNSVRLITALKLPAASNTWNEQLYVLSVRDTNAIVVSVFATMSVVILLPHPVVPENISVPASSERITTVWVCCACWC